MAGVLFALLFAVIIVLLRRAVPSDPHSAGTWLTDPDSRRQIQLALGLVPFCGIFFLWFMGAVRARVGDREDKFLATVFMGSGLLFVAMLFVLAALFGALVALAGRHQGQPPSDLWELGRETTFNLASVYATKMGAVFMVSSSTIALRLGTLSPVVIGAGFVAAVLLLLASSAVPWLQLVFPAWVLLVSINIVVLSYRRDA